ncbi:MAG: calcium/sodium antiporter [Hyphomonadaceae bacterium]|nr:calcium/sodium antiporter [Hyphomonadaceae bacterium]
MPDLSLIVSLVGGLALLAFAGDFLVNGAVSAANRLGVPHLVAGIFIVGFGTSAPEMVVAVDAALKGYPAIAFGNIVGSNIANVWLVLGLPALIAPLATGGYGETRALFAMLAATAAWIIICALMPLTAPVGIVFILALIAYGFYTLHVTAKAERAGIDTGLDEEDPHLTLPKTIAYILIGIVGLPVGANLIVEGGVGIARIYHVPEYIIGLTLIAIGTSLPEIAAGISAAMRGRGSVVVGNILGSNLFNLLGAGGLVALFAGGHEGGVSISRSFHAYDHWAMAIAAGTAALFILTRSRVTRLSGLMLLLVYALYIIGLTQGWDILALFGR